MQSCAMCSVELQYSIDASMTGTEIRVYAIFTLQMSRPEL